MSYFNQKLRKSARGESCTLQISGECNGDPETTVLAHLPDESHGMGMKADDWSGCLACSTCHAIIDGRMPYPFTPGEKEWYLRRAMVRTWRRWVALGLVKLA